MKQIILGFVVLTGKGNYKGSFKLGFKVGKNIADAIATCDLSGGNLVVKDGDKTLELGKDYSGIIKVNKLGFIEVTGIGEYAGTLCVPIGRIEPDTIPDQVYTGKAIKPQIKVTYNGTVLKKGTDYKVEYSNNTNITSSAKIKVIGIGKYSGVLTKTFKIVEQVFIEELVEEELIEEII